MNPILGSLIFAFGIAVGGGLPMPVSGQEVDPLDQLLADCEKAVSAESGSVAKFEANYVKRLTALQQDFELKGDLNKVLKVKAEIEGYSKDLKRDYADIPQLARIRKIYDDNITLIRAKAAKRRAAITVEYANKFNQQKVSLTKSGELDAALKADTFRKRLLQQFDKDKTIATTGTVPSSALWSLKTARDIVAKRGCQVFQSDGNWLLSEPPGTPEGKGWSFIQTNKKFRPPFRIASRAATDSIEIRFYLDDRHLAIFGWAVNPTNLNIHDPVSGKQAARLSGKGELEKDHFHDFAKDSMKIYLDGELRGERAGDFSELEAAVGIGQSGGSKVTVEKFEIQPLPAAP